MHFGIYENMRISDGILGASNCNASLLQAGSESDNARSVASEPQLMGSLSIGMWSVGAQKPSPEETHLCDQRTLDFFISKLLKSGTASSLQLVDWYLLLLLHTRIAQRLACGRAGTRSCQIKRSTPPYGPKPGRFDRT